jgi:Protein of unknown function (DUF1565)
VTQVRLGWAALVAVIALCAGCSGNDDASSTSTSASSVVDDTTDSSDAAPADDTPDASQTTSAPIDDTGSPSSAPGVEAAPVPALPDPAPALPCDGSTVVCVDSGASGGAGAGTASQPYPSVADALSAARAGTTIQVAAGTYAEPVVIAGVDDLRLIGGFAAGGDFSARDSQGNETVLQGTADTSVVSITASSTIHVEGFRLTGGGGSTDTFRWFGGGVHIDAESTNVAIVGNRIDSNAVDRGDDPGATVGGGIANSGNDVSIIGNVIENNRAGRGSGIASFGTVTIQGNTVTGNVSVGDHGGGLYLAGEVSVLGNYIEGNSVGETLGYGWGGGIIVYNDGTIATLQGNVITGNLAVGAGSGVFIDDGADATLIDELIFANECTTDGGTQMLVDSGGETPTVANLVNVTIAQTDCPSSGNGGALLAAISESSDPPCEVTVTRSIFWGNGGDDIVSAGCNLTVTGSDTEQAIDGEANVSVDPMFIDPASGDFSLDPASPAVGLGATGRPTS